MKKSFVLLLIGLAMQMSCQAPINSDMVIKNGVIYTMNDKMPQAQAVAVSDGKITFIGSDEDVNSWIGESTQVTGGLEAGLLPLLEVNPVHLDLGGRGKRDQCESSE